jgi:hypothetical protein
MQRFDKVAVVVTAVAGVVDNPDAGAADNNLRFPSSSRHVAPAAVAVSAAVAVAVTVAVAAAACRSSAAWHCTSAVARLHMGVKVARRQACGAEPAVSPLVRRRTVVATEPRAESAKKRAAHMDW